MLIQTRDENIEIEHVLSVFRSLVEPLIRLQGVRQNDDVSFFRFQTTGQYLMSFFILERKH
jgi:hypothetical protein